MERSENNLARRSPRLLVLMSHALTEEQRADATSSWGVESFVEFAPELRSIWSNLDPWSDDDQKIVEVVDAVIAEGVPGDLVLVQGEPGAVVRAVAACWSAGFVPIYATTQRVTATVERADGGVEKKSLFRHVRFRQYPHIKLA